MYIFKTMVYGGVNMKMNYEYFNKNIKIRKYNVNNYRT